MGQSLQRVASWLVAGCVGMGLLFSGYVWAADPGIPGSRLEWKLSGVHLVDKGREAKLPEGSLISDYVIEADASSDNQAVVANGKLRLQLSLFSPKQSQHGQKKGFWYVRGKWMLSDTNAPEAAAGSRVLPGRIGGSVLAELPASPAELGKAWSARLTVPITTMLSVDPAQDSEQARHKARGEGELKLDGKAGGGMTLSFAMWRKI